MDSLFLRNSRALITGAGRGIGEGCALALADAGADVVLVSRSQDELERVASKVRILGRCAEPVVCDVTSASDVDRSVGAVSAIDILVNCAGTNIPEPFLEVTEQHLDTVLDVNLKGTFFMSQVVARGMVARGNGGVIINISSQMGHIGAPRRTVYCASKHAVEGFTKALAVELAPHRIRVNSVAPTYVETPMTRPFFADSVFRTDTISRIPLGRIGAVQDVVGAVVYLASPAASFVTGACLLVDGGYTAQ